LMMVSVSIADIFAVRAADPGDGLLPGGR
jgi:hypothetical protein